jgi:hypothetical protein
VENLSFLWPEKLISLYEEHPKCEIRNSGRNTNLRFHPSLKAKLLLSKRILQKKEKDFRKELVTLLMMGRQ